MVYVAPSKGSHGGKSGAPKNGNKGNRGRGKEQDALASKADLLAKLTRQAEEHTRILERERAALGLPTRASPTGQAPSHPYHPQQQNQPPAASNARNRRANYHVYNDQRNKKVFDPRQVPGLGGGNGGGNGGGGGRVPPIVASEASDAEQTFNQTFPDSPNFYPGRVFAIPGTIPPPPNQPQQNKPDDGTIVVAPWGGPPQVVAAGPPSLQGQLPWQIGQPCPPGGRDPQIMGPQPMGMGMPQSQRGVPTGMGAAPGLGESQPPQQVYGGPLIGSGIDSAEGVDPRVAARMEAEARKEAYRRELEEQIRAKKQAKEAEARRRRDEDAAWEARAAAAPQPWDPEARAARRGGGGEPLRDEYGRPVANLRQRGGGPGSPNGVGPGGLGPGLPPGMPPPQLGSGMAGPFSGPVGRLTVELPNGGAGAFPGPGAGGGIIPLPFSGDVGALGPHSHGQVPGPPLTPLRLGVLPPPGAPGSGAISGGGGIPFDGGPTPMLSPSHIPPVSPGNRRFMAAMNDLIAGPSDEQRRQKEMARQRLQMDLEEQIREKRERQARERAELERQRQKEEAEVKAFQDNMAAQRQVELNRNAPAAAPGAGGQLSPQQQHQRLQQHESSGGGIDAGRPPLPPRRHGKKGKIIDASWLDAPKAPPAALPPLSSPPAVPQISPGRGLLGRRPSTGMGDGASPKEELAGGGISPGPGFIGRAASHDGATGAAGTAGGRGNVTTLLQVLQEEQSRMREDFARQAAAMEKLATDANRALADRDEAWRELQRVRSLLAGGGAAATVPGDDFLASWGIGTVIVDTHLVPKTTNSIPDPLPKPVASEVLRRGRTDPVLLDGAMRSGLLSPVARGGVGGDGGGGRGDGFAGGFFGGGFGYGDLGPLQGPVLNRNANGARRSGIPMPPGMNPGGAAQHRLGPQRIQSVYGYGFDSPPKSRYNSFFGLEQGPPASPGNVRGGGGGIGLPSLGPRKQPPLKPPPSPGILRGDHLPSPVKQTRGPQQSQPGGARARSGRPLGGGGATERSMRGRAASAAPLQSQPKSPPELPPVAPLPAAVAARTVTGPSGHVSRRSLEGMQKVLQGGHEEKLLRGLGSDDGSGSTGTTVEYVAEDVPVASRSDVRGRRLTEASLPGNTEMMSPGAAVDYLAGNGSVAASTTASTAVAGKAATRSFFSDSIASYRSLLSQRTLAAAATAATPEPEVEAGGVQANRALLSSEAISQELRTSLSEGGSSATGTGAPTPQEQGPNDNGNVGHSSGASGAAMSVRMATAVSTADAADSQSSDMPVQRPVRAGRRPSAQQRLPSPADGNAPGADSGSSGRITGAAGDVIAASAGTAVDDG
ncbi:hypothetical protein VaNZ11_014333 [Volvox africanus]|uniref:Uncharacterized protein n=1 Tax=Volvox africanus TaxID=51714 RepID=A0ABQ5SJJ5_9CHLO|nr:hypothetical protein VaNZ11_014333 [Volvox africanus]